jgi:hypothetical protein
MSLLPLLERRHSEQRGDQALRVALELAAFPRGVAVAKDQQIELGRGVAALVQLDQRSSVRRFRTARDKLVGRIDLQRPDVAEHVPRVALLDDDPH